MTISVVIADDHHIFRESLRAIFERYDDFRVVGEAANGQLTVELTDQLHPQVVILDRLMPGLSGHDALVAIKQRHPEILVVVLSGYDDEASVHEMLRAGASAYVFKDQSSADLVQAVRTVVAGKSYVSQRPPEGRQTPSAEVLTLREQQVLSLTAQGFSNAEIGQRLNISSRTVETHRSHLMLKLGFKTRLDLMRYAQERQLG